jgi:WD40 repeat protein
MGTPEYMAPEHHRGRPAAPAVDVYSLGVILYELLTGRVPFHGATFADTMLLVLRQVPVPPRRLQPGVPRDLETICLKCLEKSPTKRYESAEALADDLSRWAAGRAIHARPIGAAGRTLRWALRNPTAAVLSVAVCLVAVTGISGIVWQWNDARSNAAAAQDSAQKAEAAANTARDAADKERWERYRAGVFAASSALRLHDTNAARRSLDDAPPEHRDWVWHLLRAQLDRSHAVLGDSTEGRTGIARFTANGRHVALFDDRPEAVRVWNLESRREFRFPGKPIRASAAAISPDGTALAARSPAHDIVVYELATGATRFVARGHTNEIDSITFTPDGTRLVSASADRTVRTWDARDGKQLHLFQAPERAARPLVVSPDLRLVVGRWDGTATVRVWELETGHQVAQLSGHEDRMLTLRFSPQGDRLVTYEGYPNNVIRLWDPNTGRLLATMRGHENQIHNVAFSPDGTRIATCSMDRTVRIWEVPGGKWGVQNPPHPPAQPEPLGPGEPVGQDVSALRVLKGHTGSVGHVTFSPDGKRVVSSSSDRTLRYWDVGTGETRAVLQGHADRVFGASFRPDGAALYSAAGDGTVRVWDVAEIEDDHAVRGHTNFVYCVSFHPNGERFASAAWDGTARVWEVPSGRGEGVAPRHQLLALPHGEQPPNRAVTAVAYHPTGRYLATLARDDKVRLWEAETGALLHSWYSPGHDWRDSRLAFNPVGTLLAAGSRDGRVRLWDPESRAEVATLEGHTDGVRDVAFSPDGAWLASGGENGDMTVRIWNVATRSQAQVLRGHTSVVYALAWNPRAPLLASGSHDGTVRLWDTNTWREVGPALRQGTNVHAVAFTPNGRLLAVACADNLIRIWNVATHQILAELSGHSDYVHALAFSPDGTRLVSASGDRTIRIWDTVPPAARNSR